MVAPMVLAAGAGGLIKGLHNYATQSDRDAMAAHQGNLTRFKNRDQKEGQVMQDRGIVGDVLSGAFTGAMMGKQLAGGWGGEAENFQQMPEGGPLNPNNFQQMPMGGPVREGQEINFDQQMPQSDWDFIANLTKAQTSPTAPVAYGPQMGQPPQNLGMIPGVQQQQAVPERYDVGGLWGQMPSNNGTRFR